MRVNDFRSRSKGRRGAILSLIAMTVGGASSVAIGGILWSGDFDSGNFKQWHAADSASVVTFWQVPEYGRPVNYGGVSTQQAGDGSLLSLVTSPTRGARYSAKFTVKNSTNGLEPRDCDGSVCSRRRSELTVQQTLPQYYNAIPYMSTRWISFSVFVPSDWSNSGTGFGPIVFQLKPLNEPASGLSGTLDFSIVSGRAWQIGHRWSMTQEVAGPPPWQQQMYYTGLEGGAPYPRADLWPEGMRDFPDVAASHAALSSVRKGGWTDWVVHVRLDARGSDAGGTGFLTVWKREESGPWIKVLHVLPKQTTRGGMTFNHGIGYFSPSGSNNGGFGIKAGLYLDKNQVWNEPNDRVIYLSNVKVGDQSTLFSEMSHDGSVPASSKPKPPAGISVE